LSQFISPFINTLSDKWGGESLENRMRFPLEVCKRIKERCGEDFLVEFRMSGDEVNPKGYDITQGIEIAKMLDGHVDLIHVSTGHHEVYEAFVVTHPSMFLPDGANLHYAAEIKKRVKTPVVTVGAFNDPAHMNRVLSEGSADVIAVARGLIADPYMPKKARAGRSEDINHCLRCMTCFSRIMNVSHFTCAINPVIGREDENKYESPPVTPRRVLIAGGGIAGMQAALTASERGHDVTLYERSDRLGGALLCEDKVDFRQKLSLYLANQVRRINESPSIEVRLNTTVTSELVTNHAPDTLVVAIGSQPIAPSFIPGHNQDFVCAAKDAYVNPEKLGTRVVIIGGGLVGCELGIYLDSLGHQITILEMAGAIGFGDNVIHGQAIDVKIAQTGIDLRLNTKVTGIEAGFVTAKDENGDLSFSADSVVYAVGYQPLRAEALALANNAPEIYQIGDCVTPATIWYAVRDAYYCAKNIGAFNSHS
jgi:NADPH-dependent 2,4-dienoyl-CoA reductase/sulfur reductase-like enzyme